MKKTILYIGPAPQNIGGISIHIRRLVNLLKDDYDFDFVDEGHIRYDGIFNLRSKNIFKYIKKVINADIVHIHSGIWILRAFHIIICKLLLRKKTIVTVHRDPTIEPHAGFTKWLLSKCDHAILVNPKGYDVMYKPGKCQYHMMPAFLPPIMEDEPLLPETIISWIARARTQENAFIMCSNAWNLVMHNGEDLYGLDMCIDAMNMLKCSNIPYYLIFVVASNTDQQERMRSYKDKVSELGLSERVLIWEESVSFVRLLQLCDLVLRTTNTDGDAISVRESLFFNKPVLASNVVDRPENTNLFKTRDTSDLVEKIKSFDLNYSKLVSPEIHNYKVIYNKIYNN